ncbi:MAG: phage GP46 family protein [Roseomonas sp.]|nr:phage GP46 family protein [Roseomonas sp.]MCA3427903.1 phage GP46 family protein [Roseomonas sp.]
MIALEWKSTVGAADLALASTGALASETALQTAVVLSLFTDARARPDDGAEGDRRGWVGDAFTPEDRYGSRLWLLKRQKQTEETRRRAEDYANEALAWLVEAKLAISVSVTAAWVARGVLGLSVSIATPGDIATSQFTMRL